MLFEQDEADELSLTIEESGGFEQNEENTQRQPIMDGRMNSISQNSRSPR